MKYRNILEEELKNKVGQDYFWSYDCTKIIGKVDFCVSILHSQQELFQQESLLWAEAKKGSSDIYKSLVQLILTIGKARTFDKHLPPPMLGALDGEKIAFIPYIDIQDVFYLNDFNWNVTPSNHDTKEFRIIYEQVKANIDRKSLIFYYERDDKELRTFIKQNFVVSKHGIVQIQITKSNFTTVYSKWLEEVKPSIAVNWDVAKKNGIIDGDFYLADLLSQENKSLREKLYVLLKIDHYELDRSMDDSGFFKHRETSFNDRQLAHTQFWNRYERPPKEEYWDYIVARRDLLVPQDVRERKGSFFTPKIWVDLSQQYIADVLGEDWQDEYYVWDCAAGTGNLLTGLTNKYNIWASTLDEQDVKVMKERIQNGANLLEDHVFQFDFLNDEFSQLPQPLQDIINDPEKRKKLLVYINPPYAEATTARTVTGTGANKAKTATANKTYLRYREKIGKASNELFTQFLIRIYCEISGCAIANFSKLKNLQASNFSVFREAFQPKLEKLFVVPADTFDNVKGQFPIGFFVWDGKQQEKFVQINADVYDMKGKQTGTKTFYGNLPERINKWINKFENNSNHIVGLIVGCPPDFQHNSQLAILSKKQERYCLIIKNNNLICFSIYFAVRHCIPATSLNDRDQFLYPNDGWQKDVEFQHDCLAYTLFHGQNRITSKEGINHWIPFTERELNAREKFASNFMTQYIQGKLPAPDNEGKLRLYQTKKSEALVFSATAESVFDAGRELWRYYHQQPKCNVNASLYDIREHFQGRNDTGKMNNRSDDPTYTQLIGNLRTRLKLLAQKIEPKVYQYGFLKG